MNEFLMTSLILLLALVVIDTALGFMLLKSKGKLTIKSVLGYIFGSLLGFVLGILILSPVVLVTKRIDILRKHEEPLITKRIYDKFANIVSEESCLYFSYDRILTHCVGFSIVCL